MSGAARLGAISILIAVLGPVPSPSRSAEARHVEGATFVHLAVDSSGVGILCPHDSDLRPSDEIRLLHRISGHADSTVLVTHLSVIGERGWPFYIRPDTITIDAGSGLGFSLLQNVPDTAAVGSNRVRFVCKFLNAPITADSCGYVIRVPALVTPVQVIATPSSVRIVWSALDPEVRTATVYRRLEGSPWRALAILAVDPDGFLVFVDRFVTPTRRFEYRLGFVLSTSEIFRGDTLVAVPAPYRLAIDGLRPNPSAGIPAIFFEVPSASPATVEMFDASGRRVFASTRSWPAGQNRVDLDVGVRGGVYLLRVAQDGRVVTTKCVVRP
jgi:hypothetical protein